MFIKLLVCKDTKSNIQMSILPEISITKSMSNSKLENCDDGQYGGRL